MLSLSINAIVRAATESVEGVKDRKSLLVLFNTYFQQYRKAVLPPTGPRSRAPSTLKGTSHRRVAVRVESVQSTLQMSSATHAPWSASRCCAQRLRQWALKAAWGIHSLSGAPCHGKLKRISTHRRAGGCADAFINFSAVVIHACGTGRIDAGFIHVLFEVMLGSVTAKVSSFEIEEFYAHIREPEVIPLLLRALHAAPESIAVQGIKTFGLAQRSAKP